VVEILMAINVQAEYNLLNECKYIKSKDRCLHDTNHGFEALFGKGNYGFTNNVNMDWFIADGLFMWGISSASSCYISLEDPLDFPFEADYFGELDLDLLVRYDPDITGVTLPDTLTARLEWQTEVDSEWEADSYVEFDIYPDGVWHRYNKVMFESPYWVGNVTNLRLYIFTDGARQVEFMLKRMAFRSDVHYKCNYPPCAWNDHYTHPCPAIGKSTRAYSTTRIRRASVDTDHYRIGVSLDGYPVRYLDLDLNHCTDNYSIAQEITIKMNTLSFGGYKFAECYYDDVEESFSIYTGTKGTSGTVEVFHGGDVDATIALGFFRDVDHPTWKTEQGVNAADGYSPAYQKISANLLYRLPSSNTVVVDFDPTKPMVQIGRSDLRYIPIETLIEEGDVPGVIFIDIFGRSNYEGYINHVQFKGGIHEDESKILLLRPVNDSTFSVIYVTDPLNGANILPSQESLYEVDVSWYTRPGDVLGLYMCKPALNIEENSKSSPDLSYKYSWVEKRDPHVAVGSSLSFSTNDIKFYGFQGLPVFGYSDALVPGYGIEAELRYEYGVSHVAIIGSDENIKTDINLMSLNMTKVRLSTDKWQGPLQDAPTANLMASFDEDEDINDFSIEFWLPGYVKSVYRMVTTFEDSDNIKCFNWEYYLDEDKRGTLSWSAEYTFPTDAVGPGSAVGWVRFPAPWYVYLDDSNNKTMDPYIGQNYVTNDPYDYYPGVTDELRITRYTAADGVYWNKLDQQFTPLDTRGVRLYVWKWASPKITSVQIWAKLVSDETILHAVEGTGSSGPQVFSTEKYNIVDTSGQLWQSKRISRAETTEYTYGLDFNLQDDGDTTTAVAVVGTTLSKLDLDFTSLPAQLKQIKIIPQHLAVQVRTAENSDPITEIQNLEWGSPSDGSEYTYGPTKSYTVHNDTGFRASLILGIADPLATDQACVFASTLASEETVTDPTRGQFAEIIRANDMFISNDKGINYHARVYTPIEVIPSKWSSSTNSGIVWQTSVSGNPFTELKIWNEPENPYSDQWKVYNWAKATSVVVNSGTLDLSVMPRYYTSESGVWMTPTYFQSTGIDDTFTLETQLMSPLESRPGVDVSGGLVIFDNSDPTKHIRIERYTGNALSTVSGGLTALNEHLDKSFGDYVRYGDQISFSTISGYYPGVDLLARPEYGLVMRIIKNKTQIDLGYRLPYNTWTTASSLSIENWSDDIRIGAYIGAYAVSKSYEHKDVVGSFDYLSFKASTPRANEQFNYYYDFSTTNTTWGDWYALNEHKTSSMYSSPDGEGTLRIRRWSEEAGFKFFERYLETPAVATTWGSITDCGNIIFRLSGYSDSLMSSGTYSAGILLRDTNDSENTLKYAFRNRTTLEVKYGAQDSAYVNILPVDNASGIWLSTDKANGIVVLGYSYDGINFDVASGISLWDWADDVPVEVAFSNDVGDILFDYMQFGTSRADANSIAASFDPAFPMLSAYGCGFDWGQLYYSTSSGLENFTTTKPDAVTHVMFYKDEYNDIDIDAVKFIPDVKSAKSQHYELNLLELPQANQQLFDYTGEVKLVDPVISDGGWSQDLSYKGIPQFDSPVLLLDLRKPYPIGRCPLATNLATGRFSPTDTSMVIDAQWESSSYDEAGFNRKCLYSSNNQCTLPSSAGKPVMIYAENEDPGYFFPYECNGIQTDAGDVRKACQYFSAGTARWMMLESKDYLTTTASATGIWFVGPLEVNYQNRPIPIVNDFEWWMADYGAVQWTSGTQFDPDYTLIYLYPGLNIEGSCFFNPVGNPYWRFSYDREWTWEDDFCVDLKLSNPENINSVQVKIGRDPNCYWLFTVTGTLSNTWTTYTMPYKEATRVISKDIALTEPSLTTNELEFYEVDDAPYWPMPYLDHGYLELTASGAYGSDIYIKNFKNQRKRFDNGWMFLGVNESLYIPDVDLVNTGTISVKYRPSEAAINLVEADHRDFIFDVLNISNAQASISVVLSLQWGWIVYCSSTKEAQTYDSVPTVKEAGAVIPSKDNPGPFELVLSWAPGNIPGLTDAIVLWVNGIKVCAGEFESLGESFTTDDIKVTLGKGATIVNQEDKLARTAYSWFSDLRIFKYAVSDPTTDLENSSLIPENMLELSEDGVNWKSFVNGDLPITIPGVMNGEHVTFYMRNKRPKSSIKRLQRRKQASLMVLWEVNQSWS
jgi:hypothetical protein